MKKLLVIAAAAALTACGPQNVDQVMKEGGKVSKDMAFSFQTVEEQRAQGRANAGASAAETPNSPPTPGPA